MTATLPIQAVDAVVRIAELPGIHVLHAPADENADASVLLSLLEAVELCWYQSRDRSERSSIGDCHQPPSILGNSVDGVLASVRQPPVVADEVGIRELRLTFSHIENHVEGEYAWAVCDVEAEAWLPENEGPIQGSGRETFAFQRQRNHWKAVRPNGSLQSEIRH